MTRLLLVGARSPLGSTIGGALRVAGYDVRGTSRSGGGGTEPLDLGVPGAARVLVERVRPDAVVLLARPDLPQDDPADTIRRAAAAVGDLVAAAQDGGASRILFASSAAVYGTDEPTPRREDSATPAPTPYARLKLATEEVLAALPGASTALRIFNVHGEGFPHSLISRLRAAAAGGPPPSVHETDDFVRDYVHADDVARVVVALLKAPRMPPVINVGTGVGIGNLELLGLLGEPPRRTSPPLERPSISVADVTLLRRTLGFTPPTRVSARL